LLEAELRLGFQRSFRRLGDRFPVLPHVAAFTLFAYMCMAWQTPMSSIQWYVRTPLSKFLVH
jgi:hypothetical protein